MLNQQNRYASLIDLGNNVEDIRKVIQQIQVQTNTNFVPYTGATSDVNLGTKDLTAKRLISTQANGTAPLTVASTTLVSNLNADLLDGLHASVFKLKLWTVRLITDTDNILITDESIRCSKATPFTVTLPVGIIGQTFTIKNIGLGAVTVEGNGAETIDAELNQILYTNDDIIIQCQELTKWSIL